MDVEGLITVLSTPVAIGSAFALVFGGALLDRLVISAAEKRHARICRESTIARLRGLAAPPGVREDAARVLPAHPGTETHESQVAPGRLPGPPPVALPPQVPAQRDETLISQGDTWAAAPQVERVPAHAQGFCSIGRVQMGAAQQMAEFLSFVRDCELGLDIATGRYRVTRTGPGWVSAYRRWANGRAIVPVPELTFLRLLSAMAKAAETSGVEKSRDRIKDPVTGCVLRNGNNVPMRENVYTIYEAPKPAEPVAAPRRRLKAA